MKKYNFSATAYIVSENIGLSNIWDLKEGITQRPLMTENEIRSVMSAHGKYSLKTTNYQRFKADKTENRNHKATETVEYLHILEKQL